MPAGDLQWGTVTEAATATITFVAVVVAIALPIREQRLGLLKQESDGLDDCLRMLDTIETGYANQNNVFWIHPDFAATIDNALRRHHRELLNDEDIAHLDYMKRGAKLGPSDMAWVEALMARLNDRRDFVERSRSYRWPRRSALPDRHRPIP